MTDRCRSERSFGGRRDPRHRRRRLRRRRADPAARRRRRAGHRARRPVHRPGRAVPTARQFVAGLGHRRDARRRARRGELGLIFHLAARNIIASTKNPRDDFATNIGGTLNVLLAARDVEGRSGRLHGSSTSVYGNPRLDPDQRGRRRSCRCRRTRSASSAASTTASRSTRATGCRSRSSATRTSSASGQRPDNPYCGVVAQVPRRARSRASRFQVHGDGEQTRDYTYIDDAVDATLLAAIHPRAEGEVFNVGHRHRDVGQRTSPRRSARPSASTVDIQSHRPPRHRQHPPPRREHREGPPDAPLGSRRSACSAVSIGPPSGSSTAGFAGQAVATPD